MQLPSTILVFFEFSIELHYKKKFDLMSETFKNYVKDLDLWRTYDSARFYRVVNSILKYKVRGKFVKGIQEGDRILQGKENQKKVKLYFDEIYKSEPRVCKFCNYKIFDSNIDINRAINTITKNKVVGCGFIPNELYKDVKIEEKLKSRLDEHFRSYITTGIVPNYFMTVKLVLLSKNNQEYTEIKI